MHINPLYPVSAGLIRGVDDYLLYKLPQKRRGQFRGLSVLLHDFQKALDIDSLGSGGIYNSPVVFNGLFQV